MTFAISLCVFEEFSMKCKKERFLTKIRVSMSLCFFVARGKLSRSIYNRKKRENYHNAKISTFVCRHKTSASNKTIGHLGFTYCLCNSRSAILRLSVFLFGVFPYSSLMDITGCCIVLVCALGEVKLLQIRVVGSHDSFTIMTYTEHTIHVEW